MNGTPDPKHVFKSGEIPGILETVEGYRVVVVSVTYNHGFFPVDSVINPVIIGWVFKGKKNCLGIRVWDAFSGNDVYLPEEDDTLKLKMNYL